MIKLIKQLFKGKALRGYVSDIDKFLIEFDKKNPHRSKSQLAEIEKHARVAKLRDDASREKSTSEIWEGF